MYMVSHKQIKAARAHLGWSQPQLAYHAGVGITTVRVTELGSIPRGDTLNKIRMAIESRGIEFTENDGIRVRNNEVRVFSGPDSREMFFDDMLRTVREQGGEIITTIETQDKFLHVCGLPHGNHDKIKQLSELAHVKCLLSQISPPSPFPSSFHFRTIHRNYIGPSYNFVYGDRNVRVTSGGMEGFLFTMTTSTTYAQAWRQHLLSLWDLATPFMIQVVPPQEKKRIKA